MMIPLSQTKSAVLIAVKLSRNAPCFSTKISAYEITFSALTATSSTKNLPQNGKIIGTVLTTLLMATRSLRILSTTS